MFDARPHRLRRFAAVVLPAIVALSTTIAPASAHSHHHKRHHRRPQAHTAVPQTAPAPGTCANADTPATGATPQAMRDAVVCLINQQRAQHGLPVVSESSRLDQSAQLWTDLMVVKNIFTHGSDFWNRITNVGYNWSNVGENIASGFGTPRTAVKAWMASPDHCRNILNPNYANVGTGVNSKPVLAAATGPATWTQDFGLLMTQNAPSSNWGPANGCPY